VVHSPCHYARTTEPELSVYSFYSRIAAIYDLGLTANGYRRAARFVVGHLPFRVTEQFTALDAGCGTGLYTLAILERFRNAKVLAFDLNREMRSKLEMNLKRKGWENRANVVPGDVMGQKPGMVESFDLIVTGGLLEYVDLQDAVRNLFAQLRSAGYFLNAPVRQNVWGRMVGRWAGFRPYLSQQNLEAFTQHKLLPVKTIRIPLRFFPICLVKEAHLFRKPQT